MHRKAFLNGGGGNSDEEVAELSRKRPIGRERGRGEGREKRKCFGVGIRTTCTVTAPRRRKESASYVAMRAIPRQSQGQSAKIRSKGPRVPRGVVESPLATSADGQ